MRRNWTCLPVELRGLDVAEAVWAGRREEEDVGGDELVALHADDVADLDAVPLLLDEDPLPHHPRDPVVHLVVGAVALLQREEMGFEVEERETFEINQNLSDFLICTGLSKRNGDKFGAFRNWLIELCIGRSLCLAAMGAGNFKQG